MINSLDGYRDIYSTQTFSKNLILEFTLRTSKIYPPKTPNLFLNDHYTFSIGTAVAVYYYIVIVGCLL